MSYDFKNLPKSLLDKAAGIECLLLDVDGVMTDGGLLYGDDGQEYKRFHARDGFGLRLWRSNNLSLAMVTARRSGVVEHRANELGVDELHQGVTDKLKVIQEISERLAISPRNMAFMGDDMVDYRAMQFAGMALTVADAYPAICQLADWTSNYPGGNGAVREACELLLYSKGLLEPTLANYRDDEGKTA